MRKLILLAVLFVGCSNEKVVKIEVEGMPALSGTVRSGGPTDAEKAAAMQQFENMRKADAEAFEAEQKAMNDLHKSTTDALDK